MQNRKLADVVIIAGWNAGTATRCAGFIGNILAKHSSVAAVGWNTFPTIKFAPAAIGAIKSPRHQTGKILNGALFFLLALAVAVGDGQGVGCSTHPSKFKNGTYATYGTYGWPLADTDWNTPNIKQLTANC